MELKTNEIISTAETSMALLVGRVYAAGKIGAFKEWLFTLDFPDYYLGPLLFFSVILNSTRTEASTPLITCGIIDQLATNA